MLMKKRALNLLIDENLKKKARSYHINLSSFLEVKLREYLALIEGKQNNSSLSPPTQKPSNIDDAEGGIRTPEEQKLHRLSRPAPYRTRRPQLGLILVLDLSFFLGDIMGVTNILLTLPYRGVCTFFHNNTGCICYYPFILLYDVSCRHECLG